MRRSFILMPVCAAAVLVAVGSPAASAQTLAYSLKGCGPFNEGKVYPHSEVCLYKSGSSAKGTFHNGESYGIKNQGAFEPFNGPTVTCGNVTTAAGATATCTRTLHGGYFLYDGASSPKQAEARAPYDGYVGF